MNKQLTAANSFQVKVLDEFLNIMFVATIDYNKVTAFSREVSPHIVSITKVESGKGNAGNNLEYQQTTDGNCMDYQKFVSIMNSGY